LFLAGRPLRRFVGVAGFADLAAGCRERVALGLSALARLSPRLAGG
jgi:hypothetical protein